MMRPKLLDLFCGAGGATKGYQRAGFSVVGVDNQPQPDYCGDEFHQADALTFPIDRYDAIHASPPCQRYSYSTPQDRRSTYPDLVGPTRQRLVDAGVPWVIENVPGAPIRADFVLCGCMFGLIHLKRVRWFETSWHAYDLRPPCIHLHPIYTVVGNGTPSGNRKTLGRNVSDAERKDAMGIHWMNRRQLSQSIPPAYTEYIGRFLYDAIMAAKAVAS